MIVNSLSKIVDDLQSIGWTLQEDPDVADFQKQLLTHFAADLPVFVNNAMSLSTSTDNWVTQSSGWESTMDNLSRTMARQEMLGQCNKLAVTAEFLQDAKKRWERAEFTSVSNDYLVIGDIFVQRRGDKLVLKNEVDFATAISHIGRTDLTYHMWSKRYMMTPNLVRPKINGERFVLVIENEQTKYVGFKEINMTPGPNYPTLLECYAGTFYALTPGIFGPLKTTTNEVIKVVPHPFMTPDLYFNQRTQFCGHKFDGIMLYDEKEEIRVKWRPTTEIIYNGLTWEVTLNRDKIIPIRPRPGKMPIKESNVRTKLTSLMRAGPVIDSFIRIPQLMCPDIVIPPARQPPSDNSSSLVPHPQRQQKPIDQSVDQIDTQAQETKQHVGRLLNEIQASQPKQHNVGSKIFLLTRSGTFVAIREPGKKLDLIGGRVEANEGHLQCLLREFNEETQLELEYYSYLGPSEVEVEQMKWTSHVYLGVAPAALLMKPNIEQVTFASNLKGLIKFPKNLPHQPWFERHLKYCGKFFQTFEQAWAQLLFRLVLPPLPRPVALKVKKHKEHEGKLVLAEAEGFKSLMHLYSKSSLRRDFLSARDYCKRNGILLSPENYQVYAEQMGWPLDTADRFDSTDLNEKWEYYLQQLFEEGDSMSMEEVHKEMTKLGYRGAHRHVTAFINRCERERKVRVENARNRGGHVVTRCRETSNNITKKS